jgi:tripartite-type tricarboxylate transporter receptor subunit TctC
MNDGLSKRRFLQASILLGSGLGVGAAKSDNPQKLKIIVPFTAGGVVDGFARMLAEALNQTQKYQAYVVNKPGAGGIIASMELTKKSGNEIACMVGTTVHALQPYRKNIGKEVDALYSKLQFQAILGRQDSYMLVSSSRKIESLANLCDTVQVPKYGSQGIGSVGHLAGAELMSKVNKESIHVPFNSSPEIVNAILAGDIDFGLLAYDNFRAVLQAKKVKVLLSVSREASKIVPGVPLAKSLGLTELTHGSWFSLVTSRALDRDLAAVLLADINVELHQSSFSQTISKTGIEIDFMRGDTMRDFMNIEIKYWAELLAKHGNT